MTPEGIAKWREWWDTHKAEYAEKEATPAKE
jgi:hypothetical protein